MKKPKVLMLGWEYPPLVNGGLGIACQGLSKALSSLVDLSMIVPKASTTPQGFQLIGLNEKKYFNTLTQEIPVAYTEFIKTYPLAAELNPYLQIDTASPVIQKVTHHRKLKKTVQVETKPFDIAELYGNDLLKNTTLFTQYAAEESKHLDFDVIHCHDWMTIPAGIEIKRRTGKPLIYHVHSLEHDRCGSDSTGLIFQIEKWGMEQADKVVPVSNYTGRIAFSKYGIDPKKLYTVHNGTEPIKAYKKEKPFKDNLVVFVGRMTEQKAPQQFIEIAQRVLETNPNTRFVMAGTGNLLASSIESIARLKKGNRIHFTGHINRGQLFDLLAMADVYCMPSVSEPFGLTALEATQFKVPCVVSAQSGMYEVLKGALYADHWQTKRFAEHIVSLLDSKELRNKCLRQAAKDIQQCTWENAAKRTVALYEKLIG